MPNSTQGLLLMTTVLIILVIPGILFNNLNASGLVAPNTTNVNNCPQPAVGYTSYLSGNQCMQCTSPSTNPGVPVCQLEQPVGCQANPNGCSFVSTNPIQFLNACSPFTNILTLNFAGFVSSLFSNCGVAGNQFTYTSFNTAVLPTGNQNTTFAGCTAYNDVLGFYGPLHYKCTTANPSFPGLTLPVNASLTLGPLFWNGVIGNLTVHSVPSYVTVNFIDSSHPLNAFVANCLPYGNYYGNPSDPRNAIHSLVCVSFTGFVAVSGTSSGTLGITGVLSVVLSIIGLALVVLIGLGVYLAGGGGILGSGINAAFGSNPQGTKQAFTFGAAMVIWFPLYSEFSTWFTSGILPAGLDGAIGIISVALIAGFFFGVYSLSQTGTATST